MNGTLLRRADIGGDFAYRIDGVIRGASKGLGTYNFANGILLNLFNFTGTGTVTAVNSAAQFVVTAGQFHVGQSRIFHQYIPANPTLIEITGDNLHPISGTSVEVGYGSDSIVSPFSGSYDGFRYRTDDTTSYFEVMKGGVVKLSIARASWDNPLVGYDFQNFTVMAIDYLYLGGAGARFFVKMGKEFVLAHTFNYAGTSQGTFINNPSLPVRIAVRSTTGTRTTNIFCARVVTEGDINESIVINKTFYNLDAGVVSTVVGTRYALLGIKLKSASRNDIIKIIDGTLLVQSTNDHLRYAWVLNPTVANTFTYADVTGSPVQTAIGVANNTVTGGLELPSNFGNTGIDSKLNVNNILNQLGSTIDGVMDSLVLVATPLTSNITINAIGNYARY